MPAMEVPGKHVGKWIIAFSQFARLHGDAQFTANAKSITAVEDLAVQEHNILDLAVRPNILFHVP